MGEAMQSGAKRKPKAKATASPNRANAAPGRDIIDDMGPRGGVLRRRRGTASPRVTLMAHSANDRTTGRAPTSEVRLARRGDANGLLALYRELRPQDPVLSPVELESNLDRLLADEGTYLVVYDAERTLASTCMLAVAPSLAVGGRPFGIIEQVVTLPGFRRRGLARAVLEYALDLAWGHGCYKVLLLSGAQREEAHKLYRSVGFRDGIETGFVARPKAAA